MKRVALIAGAAVVLLSGIGAGIYFYLKPSLVSRAAMPAPRPNHKMEAAIGDPNAKIEKSAELSRLVERLGAVQDRVVRGDHGALADQGRLLSEISGVLRHFEKRDWNSYANVRGAFVYVLSGGDYGVLKPLAEDNSRYEADRMLAQGIMQYGQGKTNAARKLLADVDPRSLDVSLVGPFALARASFYIGHDDAKAIALLDEARLASPHTAIEEAAARREIPVLIGSGDTSRAMLLMTDYLRRFGKSIYAWKLFRDFSAAVAKREEFDSSDVVDKLTTATSAADKQSRIDLLLAMAAAALPPGRIVLARAAASEALSLKPDSAEDIDRATLYEAAANAPTTHAAEALTALHQIAVEHLSDSDIEIHEVAGYIAHTVTSDKVTADDEAHKLSEQKSVESSSTPHELSLVSSAVESADAAIKEADMVMSGNVK
jgi:chemotaxis protein MotC